MRLLLMPALAAAAAAADLPVTGITVIPGGLIIERAGAVPAGDETVAGLPAVVDEGSLSVEIDGREVDGWRLVRPEPTPPRPADPALLQRLAAAERASKAAGARAALAEAARAGEAKDRPAKPDDPRLPGPEAIRGQVAFAATNAERAASEAQAAAEALDAAHDALAAAPGTAAAPPVLRVPGMGGRTVRLRYLLPGASWSPAWRLEVDGGEATLVQLATVDVLSGATLPAVPLTVASRGRADAALLADPSVPILGLAESVELERKAAPAAGGSRGSESAVDTGLRSFARTLRTGTGSVAGDASQLLVLLGAGYDHKTPNKFKTVARIAIERLAALDPAALDLPVLALTTTALAEAYAMTSDPELRPRAETHLACLRNRWPRELRSWLVHAAPLAGPQAAALVAQALKSAYAGGLPLGDDLGDLRRLDLGQGEEAEIARLFIDVYTGRKPAVAVDQARRWVAAFDRWWDAGRIELIQQAVLVAFQVGGEVWTLVNSELRPRLTGLQIRSGPDQGLWPLDHHPLGKLYASAQAALCLEVYYRYAQVGSQRSEDAKVQLDRPEPELPTPLVLIPWPVRQSAAAPVALAPGRQVVELRRARLAGAIAWEAVPVQSPGVWRRLSAPNPWSAPLPGGPVAVVADGRDLGTAVLVPTAPGATITLDLGPDDRLRVRRTVRPATDDGVFKRTLAMTVTCRLEAPPGFAGRVRVAEPLPRPGPEEIAVALLKPEALEGEAYAKRVAKDPLAVAHLSVAAPETVVADLRLTYPRSVRPRLEAR